MFWEICLLRGTPRELPRSPVLLGLVVALGLVIDNINLGFAVPAASAVQVAGAVLVHTGLLAGSLTGLLALTGYAARVVQTLTALIGSGLILSLIAMPLIMLSGLSGQLALVLAVLLVILNIWSLLVTMHILRHALSINRILAGLLAAGYYLLSLMVIERLLPGSA